MSRRALLGFSGGLDTSYCVLYLRELGYEVDTVTFDVGGLTDEDRTRIADRSRQCGAGHHKTVDLRQELCDRVLTPLIRGGMLKGGNYPYCVGAERGLQAEGLAQRAIAGNYDAVAHGSTGAGNDQVRFDVTLRALLPDGVEILTPVRTLGLSRAETTARLEAAGIPVEAKTTQYSVNSSLWGTTLGGGPVLDPAQDIPEDLRHRVLHPNDCSMESVLAIEFEHGLPVSMNGERMALPDLIEGLNELGELHGIGRDVHTGDTVLGIKGRIVFEAPAAALIHLAHRELTKLTLSKWQLYLREQATALYGMLMHEGLWLDPVLRDIEAYLENEQMAVEGHVTLYLGRGWVELRNIDSPNSRMKGKALYGETTGGWDGRDAEGFAKLFGQSLRRRT